MSTTRFNNATNPIEKILTKAVGIKEIRVNEWMAQCPCHEDNKASLHITETPEHKVLLKCHAGCNNSDIMREWGLEMKDLFPPRVSSNRSQQQEKPRIVAIYDYKNDKGELIFQSVRYEPKGFKQRRPDGRGGWIWNLQGIKPLPYRLPEILSALDDGEMVFIVEGEKDVDNLYKIGFVATCNSGGAGKWRELHGSYFPSDSKVTILPDNDESGRHHARQVTEQLRAKGCQTRTLTLPGLPDKGDVSDWLKDHSTVDLQVLVDGIWSKPEGPVEEEMIRQSINKFPHTDLGNSERLINKFGADLRYCHEQKKWFLWTGKRWQEDNQGRIYHLATQTIRSIIDEAQGLPDAERMELVKWSLKSESRDKIKAMVDLAQNHPDVVINYNQFDLDPWLLNLQNGTLDLKTGKLQPHRREDYNSKISPVEYDASATAPTWKRFIKEIMGDKNDLVEYLHKASGYSLTGLTTEADLYICHGTGANGKSVFINTIMAMLGSDYTKQTAATALLVKQSETQGEEIACLAGARFVACSETDDGKRLAEGLVKQLTGGDKIRARFLYGNSFEFYPVLKLWMATNHKPRVTGTDAGIWRRLKLIPFDVSFPDDKQDRQLPEKLKAELPGILNWCVQGCLKWQQEGIKAPTAVMVATTGYREENDVIGAFLSDSCKTGPGFKSTAKNLYSSYVQWCEDGGERPLSQRKFGSKLRERGLTSYIGTGNKTFWNVGIIVGESTSTIEKREWYG